MKLKIIIFLLFSIMCFISCSSVKHRIHENNKATEKKKTFLLEKNGNVFCISSTYSTFSVVWSYNERGLILYKLTNGRITLQKECLPSRIKSVDINCLSNDEAHELDECLELDGDSFEYTIKKGIKIEKQAFPINIECFTKANLNSELLNRLVEDIKNHKIWDVQWLSIERK